MSTASLETAAVRRSIKLPGTNVVSVIRPRCDDVKTDKVTSLMVKAAEQAAAE
jgi:hypothetical protein